MPFLYCDEAKQRIRKAGVDLIQGIFDEVPEKTRSASLQGLPDIHGFRKNSSNQLKEKQKRLISHLVSSSLAGQKDWDALSYVWANWVCVRLKTKTMPFPSKLEEAHEGALQGFITFLVRDYSSLLSREEVEGILNLGPFELAGEGLHELSKFKSKEEVDRQRLISKLVEDVDSLKNISSDLTNRIEGVISSISDFDKRFSLEEIGRNAELLNSAFLEEKSEREKLHEEMRSLAKVASDAKERAEKCFGELASAKDNYSKIEDLSKEIKRVGKESAAIWEEVTSWAGNFDVEVEGIKKTLSELTLSPGSKKEDGGGHVCIEFNCLKFSDGLEVVDVESVPELRDLLAKNLAAAGLTKTDAYDVSVQISAALRAKQVVQFEGSLASYAARVCGLTVSAENAWMARIPVGLCSGGQLESFVERAKESKRSTGLVIDGANSSAFEVYGAAVRSAVIEGQFESPLAMDNVFFFTAWVSGPATFSAGPVLAELGPVINTDILSWKRGASQTTISPGRLSVEFSKTGSMREGDSTEALEEIVRCLPRKCTRLFERIIFRAYSAIREATESDDVSSMLLLGWIVPWLRELGVAKPEIEEFIKAVSEGQAPRRLMAFVTTL